MDLCRRRTPSLVLTDIGLPDVSGINLTSRIRALLPDVHIIVVSQNVGSAYVELAYAAGADAYVAKSRVSHDLLRTITVVPGGTARWKL